MTSKTKAKKPKPTDLFEIAEPDSVNQTTERAIVVSNFSEVVASVMNEAQFQILSGRTPKQMIKHRPGKGGKTFAYVPHGYVTAQLNRAFGFDWDFETLPNGKGNMHEFIESTETMSNGKTVRTPASVIVTGRLTIRIRNPRAITQVVATIAKTSTGEKEFVPGMTWGSMIKSAESDALKKCATRLGVALDLYWQDADDDYLSGNGKPPEPVSPDKLAQARTLIESGRKDYAKVAAECGLSMDDLISAGLVS